MWSKINFDKLILLLLPTFLRKPVLFAYMKALAAPLVDLYDRWDRNRLDNLFVLRYNAQRCYLRAALNDNYDWLRRRITISNTGGLDQDYIYTPSEKIVVHLGTMYLEQSFNIVGTSVDYIVKVPRDVYDKRKDEIEATVAFYNLAGKLYEFQIVD